jgi:hypothetical protein
MSAHGRRPRRLYEAFALCFLLLALAACGGGEELPTPTAAPEPTATTQPTATVDSAATATAVAAQATAAADTVAAAATETAFAATVEPVRRELATYGVDPFAGELAWVHPPITLEIGDPEEFVFANQFALTVARDFVMAADVNWSSASEESGCGFAMRSDGNEETPNQYLIGLARGALGHVLFAEQIAGEVDRTQVTDIYAAQSDPLFQGDSGTANRIAVVAQGEQFTIYSNGTRLGAVTGRSGFAEGFVAFIAVNGSGGIRCDFSNGWLWRMN